MKSKPELIKCKGELARKVSRYSAATIGGVAGTLAGFESADAALVITSASISIADGVAGFQTSIDLNADATDDVLVTVVSANILTAQGLNGASLAAGTVGAFFYPAALAASDNVGAQPFSGGTLAATNTFGTLANSNAAVGNWLNTGGAVDGYLGVQFSVGADTHYGWVHIVWDGSTDTATIDQYAFEDVAGAPAKVPEPSSLALLGLGVGGLALRRRRAKKN